MRKFALASSQALSMPFKPSHTAIRELSFTTDTQPLPLVSIKTEVLEEIGKAHAAYCAMKLKDRSLLKSLAYVNGEWTGAKSGNTFQIRDPATHSIIGTMPEMDASDVKSAIKAASCAFESFRETTGRERARMLRCWHQLMLENAEDLATLITWENGKPLNDAAGEVTYAASFLEWFAEEAPRIYGDTIPASIAGNRIMTFKEPVGVCGLITPWNFPAAMITRKIGPALATGCTVVAKSPGEAPLTAAALAELAHRAGIPKGVINLVTALDNSPKVGEVICASPTVRKVSFTGSTKVGKTLMKNCASTMKKLSLELGGNSPFVVFDDANLELAVSGAIASKFRSSGQTCICANRIYVQKGIYDAFATAFAEKVKAFKVGNGFEENVTHGPLVHENAAKKVETHIKDALDQGAKLMTGGEKLPKLGSLFYQPTVLRDMSSEMLIAREETFGPVAGLFSFDTEEEVIHEANATEFGLAGYVFSQDINRAFRVAEALELGMIGLNTGLISDTAAPFGGVKESGFGREGSKYGAEEFLVLKTLTIGGMS